LSNRNDGALALTLFNQSKIEIDGLHVAIMWAFEDDGGSKSIKWSAMIIEPI